jgi:hypothetical protein
MGDDHRWMHDGWNRSGAHTDEWWDRTKDVSSVHSLWRVPKRSGVRASNVKT